MDNVFANQTLTPELLEGYFDSMEQAVEQFEKSVPNIPPGKGNPFAERRLVSLWSTEKPGSPVTEARVRPDWRTLTSRAEVVPYKLEAVKVLPDTGRIEELSGVSRLASYAQRPG